MNKRIYISIDFQRKKQVGKKTEWNYPCDNVHYPLALPPPKNKQENKSLRLEWVKEKKGKNTGGKTEVHIYI